MKKTDSKLKIIKIGSKRLVIRLVNYLTDIDRDQATFSMTVLKYIRLTRAFQPSLQRVDHDIIF